MEVGPPGAATHVYVPWIAFTSGAGAGEPERTKNIHARAKMMARAMRTAAKLGGRRLIRPERTRRLARSDGRRHLGHSITAPLPTGSMAPGNVRLRRACARRPVQ